MKSLLEEGYAAESVRYDAQQAKQGKEGRGAVRNPRVKAAQPRPGKSSKGSICTTPVCLVIKCP